MSTYKEALQLKQQKMKLAAVDFANGTPIKEVMSKYGVCYASVYNAIKRYKVDYKYTYGRTIFFNEDYFKDIVTEHQAYYLGFIYADGTIVKTDSNVSDYNRLQIGISVEDIEVLKGFAKVIDYPEDKIIYYNPPNSYASTEMCYIQCNSMKMVGDLIELGCFPNKTLHSYLPELRPDLLRHFIRGYFDGDGSISVFQNYNKVTGAFTITSEGEIIEQLQDILMEACGLKRTKLVNRRNCSALQYGGRQQLMRIYHYLYDDATVYLQRKYDKFHSIAFVIGETISSPAA